VYRYTSEVPKLWRDTIATHRREVRQAILETTATLVGQLGLRAVTMSQIAEHTGIGRATLYKYFPDVESILIAWHEGHVAAHLEEVAQLRDGSGRPAERLAAVLAMYSQIQYKRRGSELHGLLHREEHMAPAQQRFIEILTGLLQDGVSAGEVRADIPAAELASYCLHALAGAGELPSETAVQRLAKVTLDGVLVR